ncbi:MAG: energy transducer TonB, partial [Thermodesulfobacteriota bacterium]
IHRATPLYKTNPLPRYPASARRRGFEGTVKLLVQVSEKGDVTELEVARSSGHQSLDRRAVETVKNWKFEPGRINGEASAMDVKIPVTFRLE